jgi:hypothetical protein
MKKRYQRTAFPQYLIVGALIVIAIGIGVASRLIMAEFPFADHFAIPWAAGRGWLLEGQNPYDPMMIDFATTTLAETDFLGDLPNPALLEHPVITLFLYLPFSLIPYEISRSIWMALQVISVLLIGFFALKLSVWKISNYEMFFAVILLLAWLPSVSAIINGQLSTLILLFVFVSIYLLLNGQTTVAGFFLALTFGSFQTTFFIILLLLIWSILHRHWDFLGAYFAGIAFLIAISIILLPSWPLDWLGIMLQKFDGLSALQTPLMILASTLPGIASYLMVFLHVGTISYLLFVWFGRGRKTDGEFAWKMVLTLVLAFLLHIQAGSHHLLLIVPGTFLIFRFWTERWGTLGRIISGLAYLLIIMSPWLSGFKNIDFSKESVQPALLIGLPLLVMIGLLSVRWWAVKVPKLPFENR